MKRSATYMGMHRLVAFLFLGLTGCGDIDISSKKPSEESREREGTEEMEKTEEEGITIDLAEALNEAGDAIHEVLGGVDPVDFDELEDLLPDEVDGLDRTEKGGESINILGVAFAVASATYTYDFQSITVSIADLGTLSSFAAQEHGEWLDVEIDRESDRGYERTRKFHSRGKTYPGYEKFETHGDGGECAIHVLVEERFVVSIEGEQIEMGQCEEALDKVSFRRLERLRRRAEKRQED